ncbi:hypothetical protein PILCRDRAFT_72442, partial [Piloderma croceum F 1598]
LKRSLAAGSGAPSRTNIAEVLFGVDAVYALLPDAQKKMVVRQEELLFQWKNSRAVGAVFSSKCQKETLGHQDDNQLLPCTECRDLLKLHTFQVALNRPIPDDANMKFMPISHQDLDVGDIYFKVKGIRDLVEMNDGNSPWLKFARGVVDGVYAKKDVLLGMVEALVIKTERLAKGKSLKNMSYPSAFSDFCNILASTSMRCDSELWLTAPRVGRYSGS